MVNLLSNYQKEATMDNRNAKHLDPFRKNIKIVDAVSYNGRYIEASALRNKIITLSSLCLAALASFALLFWL